MSTTFGLPVNNFVTTLSASHAIADGQLVLTSATGLGSLPAGRVFRVTALSNPDTSSESVLGIFEATGLSTNTLTGVTAVEGFSDVALSSGITIEVRTTAKCVSEIQTAVNNLEVGKITSTSVTGATTLTAASMGQQIVCSGTAANYNLTLPDATTVSGQSLLIRMSGALTKLVTLVTQGGQTIDGASTRVMWAGETATLVSDGANWFKVAGRTLPLTACLRLSGAQSIPDTTGTTVTLDTLDFDNSGLVANTSSHELVIPRPGKYQVSLAITYVGGATSGPFTAYLVVNGTNGDSAKQPAATGSYPAPTMSFPKSFNAGDVLTLLAYQGSGGSVSLSTADTNLLAITEVPQW